VVVHQNGHRQGGDWSEKIVSELAALLGLPCAEVQLATRGGEDGTISRNVTPDRWELLPGYVWMSAKLPDYVGGQRRRGSPGHSLANIERALQGCAGPPGCDAADALSAFAGYLVMDAWVANRDRHDRNWAVLRSSDDPERICLAPSFDHTSSLGFNLRDSERREKLAAPGGVARWTEKGLANQFEHDIDLPKSAIPTLVDIAHRALDLLGGSIGALWLDRLRSIDGSAVRAVVEGVPGLSPPTTTFILELLETNRGRLLGDHR
jgi:hypothetical protein